LTGPNALLPPGQGRRLGAADERAVVSKERAADGRDRQPHGGGADRRNDHFGRSAGDRERRALSTQHHRRHGHPGACFPELFQRIPACQSSAHGADLKWGRFRFCG
jgi:hypothetical protein